jgi:hypothetical protein
MGIECTDAHLGLATTEELLHELRARGEVSFTIGEFPEQMGALAAVSKQFLNDLPEEMLKYKTVETEEEFADRTVKT